MDPVPAQNGVYLKQDQGVSIWAFGVMITLRLFGKDTGGHFALHEDVVMPGLGPPPHYHTREDEYWYVVEGKLRWTRGDEVFHATKGSLIHLPKNVPHSLVNDGDTPARMVVTYAPAGFETWFQDIGEPVKEGSSPYEDHPLPTPESLGRAAQIAAEKYGVHFSPPRQDDAQKDEL